MRPFIFSPPEMPACDIEPDLELACDSTDRKLELLAESTCCARDRLEHAFQRVCARGEELARATIALLESSEAVAEASMEIRFEAHMRGEIEYLDEIAGNSLVEVLGRMARTRPPESMQELHDRLWERERVWQEDYEATRCCGVLYRDALRRFSVAERRFVARREELKHAVRRAARPVLRRAA